MLEVYDFVSYSVLATSTNDALEVVLEKCSAISASSVGVMVESSLQFIHHQLHSLIPHCCCSANYFYYGKLSYAVRNPFAGSFLWLNLWLIRMDLVVLVFDH